MTLKPTMTLSYRVQVGLGRSRLVRSVETLLTRYYKYIPPLPGFVKGWHATAPVVGPQSLATPRIARRLLTVAGIQRDPVSEESAFRDGPVYHFNDLYPEIAELRAHGSEWLARLPMLPMHARIQHRLESEESRPVSVSPTKLARLSSPDLTEGLKQRAAELGISAVGVAEYDRKYIFERDLQTDLGDRVVVCILETNWDATQTAPSTRHERAALHTMFTLGDLCRQLAAYLRDHGYRVKGPLLAYGYGVSIHYAVEAGLGQLGLNGQLLTPFAGSRCRLMLLHTNAPLELDGPRDYGVPRICDSCKACVRRCPTGAIPAVRRMHRGVYKARIKTERCYPAVMQAEGCGVCLKVCPIQRYGLTAVLNEFADTGRILGKQTDELEGYDWPVDGRRYSPGQKPRSAISYEFLHPGGYVHDPLRGRPVADSKVDNRPHLADAPDQTD